MLGDLFSDEEKKTEKLLTEKSMVDSMELPEIQRKKFVGLKNQGATCYLNSLFQTLFFIPEIRKIFLELDFSAVQSDIKF